ncbi:hypothetical protein EIP86_006106 [Pleurotus ostreatoroseus]|nr:hypothetical protein EIP86_006106 [Pleurotus ostreatoroseus]
MPRPAHAFNPWLEKQKVLDWGLIPDVVWEGTGLRDEEYFAHRNDSAPLVVAAQLGDIDAVRTRLAAGDDIASAGLDGETALHMASALGFVDIVQLLLENGADPELQDKEHSTPLMHCARFCPANYANKVADLLIAAGGDPARLVKDGELTLNPVCMTPLSLAIRWGNVTMARYLIPFTELQACKTWQGNEYVLRTMEMCRSGQNPEKGDEILRGLLDAGIYVGEPEVKLALRVGRWNVVESVLKASGLNEEWFMSHATQLLKEALDVPRRRDYPYADIASHFFTSYGADPNDLELQHIVLSNKGEAELLDVALKAGMDLALWDDAEFWELSLPSVVGKEWSQLLWQRRREQVEAKDRKKARALSSVSVLDGRLKRNPFRNPLESSADDKTLRRAPPAALLFSPSFLQLSFAASHPELCFSAMLRKIEGSTVSLATKAANGRTAVVASSSSGLLRRAIPPTIAAQRPLSSSLSRPSLSLARGYASQPPNGGGGFPGFSMQPGQRQKGEALKEYSVDLTELARNGKLDPTIGRDEEIRRTIQILSRRTKSNPVLIGPPGVGKTAILEGLASRIVAKEVPESLQNKRVLSIDLAAIMAGSGIRGAFEEKFKALVRDIEDEAENVICFIDEVHTLFQLGKAEGSIDAGQMIKPALARGLRLVGATTPDEYRQTIAKDAALERRFQPVQIEEPAVESTISILRGLKPRYEVHHGVEISDAALVTAAVYSARYVSDRYLPDKAIDLVDEAASALRLAQESKPDELEKLDREIMTLQIELESLKNESDVFSVERRNKVEDSLRETRKEADELTQIWQAERSRLERVKELKQKLEDAKYELEVAQRQGQYEKASRLRFATIPELERQLPKESERPDEDTEGPLSMLHDRVTSNDIARVVAKATGIPVQNLMKGEREKLVHMEDALKGRVVGQDHVVTAVSDAVRISRAGLQAPNRPVASFLFLGPTGVGKTELCKALAGFLFNDEQRGLININMSEYHDRHTISRLIGAAPGYVGFEEGAVILLDELEKAHKDVAMILLQILDEGKITDSHGRKVDFKNTIICLTSNLGSDILAHKTASDSNGLVTADARDQVIERVSEYFPPELLNRLDSMLVFNKLSRESILQVVSLRLEDVQDRLKHRRITVDVDEPARNWLADQGYSDLYGARAIARIVRSKVLFPLAQKLLKGTIRDGDTVAVRVSEQGNDIDIKDNHEADTTIASASSPSSFPELGEKTTNP